MNTSTTLDMAPSASVDDVANAGTANIKVDGNATVRFACVNSEPNLAYISLSEFHMTALFAAADSGRVDVRPVRVAIYATLRMQAQSLPITAWYPVGLRPATMADPYRVTPFRMPIGCIVRISPEPEMPPAREQYVIDLIDSRFVVADTRPYIAGMANSQPGVDRPIDEFPRNAMYPLEMIVYTDNTIPGRDINASRPAPATILAGVNRQFALKSLLRRHSMMLTHGEPPTFVMPWRRRVRSTCAALIIPKPHVTIHIS